MKALPAPFLSTPDGGHPADEFGSGMTSTCVFDAGPAEAGAAMIPWDLDGATTRQLRRWSDRLYRLLGSDVPPYGTRDDYDRVTAELERREEHAGPGPARAGRRFFRDNPLSRHFQSFPARNPQDRAVLGR